MAHLFFTACSPAIHYLIQHQEGSIHVLQQPALLHILPKERCSSWLLLVPGLGPPQRLSPPPSQQPPEGQEGTRTEKASFVPGLAEQRLIMSVPFRLPLPGTHTPGWVSYLHPSWASYHCSIINQLQSLALDSLSETNPAHGYGTGRQQSTEWGCSKNHPKSPV